MPDAQRAEGREILCVGEVLWDALPAGLFLGGAPLNVAAHLCALGVPVAMLSRVGDDRLGHEARARLARHGLDASLVQVDPALPTGFVAVTLDADGIPAYDIVAPAAWDRIALDDALLARAAASAAVVFGSLAQRDPVSRATIAALCAAAPTRVFDVNLRAPYDDAAVVERSLTVADVVKLNDDELARMAGWFALPTALRAGTEALAARFGCRTVCVTRGAAGAALLHDGRWTEHAGFRVAVHDTVGAGDAFLAALLAGLRAGDDDAAVLAAANRRGAYVATQPGAVPVVEPAALARLAAR